MANPLTSSASTGEPTAAPIAANTTEDLGFPASAIPAYQADASTRLATAAAILAAFTAAAAQASRDLARTLRPLRRSTEQLSSLISECAEDRKGALFGGEPDSVDAETFCAAQAAIDDSVATVLDLLCEVSVPDVKDAFEPITTALEELEADMARALAAVKAVRL